MDRNASAGAPVQTSACGRRDDMTVRPVGRRRQLARAIVAWIGDRASFAIDDARRAFPDVSDCEFGPALNRARDELRERGLEYAPDGESPGTYVRLEDDARIVRRSLRFRAGARRKDRRAAAIAECVQRPEALPPVLQKAHERATETSAVVEASSVARAARRRLPGC